MYFNFAIILSFLLKFTFSPKKKINLFSALVVLLHRNQHRRHRTAVRSASLGQTQPLLMVHPLCPAPESPYHCFLGLTPGMEARGNTGLANRGTSRAQEGLCWSNWEYLWLQNKQVLLWRRWHLFLPLFRSSSLLTREERIFL